MERNIVIKSIVDDSYTYFRSFALASNIQHRTGKVEWIHPVPGTQGPSIVFKVSMDASAQREIDGLIGGLREGSVPSLWVINPLSNPDNIVQILASKGFENRTDEAKPEFGMALELTRLPANDSGNESIKVKRVLEVNDYKTWIDIVNCALHGWDMLTYDNYATWLKCESIAFYLAFWEGIPVCTVATIRNGHRASIEFVSTLEEYRHKCIAYAACLQVLSELKTSGVKLATLRSNFEAHTLYLRLGFLPYYTQQLLCFPKYSRDERNT